MTTAILVALALVVGYLLGEWRTLKQHEHEIMHTNQELKFWKDIADRQRKELRGPLDGPLPPPTSPPGIRWKDQST